MVDTLYLLKLKREGKGKEIEKEEKINDSGLSATCLHTLHLTHLLSKQNVVGLSLRKHTKLLMTMLHGLELLCRGHCMTMYSHVWGLAWPHGQLKEALGKNL